MANNELVSVIITTKNEERNIKNCLKSIKEQSYPKIEIIVVDNNSDDKTKEIAKKLGAAVFNKGPERSAQRNFGMIKKAKGKYAIFLDADMIISPSLIKNCVKLIEKNKYAALHIPEIVLGRGYFSKVRRFERRFYNGTVIDGARFFIRKIFTKTRGFDENLRGPEDWDIDKKIKKFGIIGFLQEKEKLLSDWKMKEFIAYNGIKPEREGCVIYHNESEFNLKKYLEKKACYAEDFDSYIEKWGETDEDIKKQFSIYYRFFGVFAENGKWKKLIRRPLLAVGMYFLRILVGINFLRRKGNEV
ncbi:MAG: glycosyltransferase [Nanoarchaeota archaeon]